MPFVTVPAGVRLHYRDTGRAHRSLPMLFVHGWCSSLGDWAPQARAFSRRHRVVRIDLRGHGASEAPRGGYRLRTFASDVEAVARQLDLDRALLVGHSMGGGVVLELARLAPALAAGVVMVDGIVGRGRPARELDDHPAIRSPRRRWVRCRDREALSRLLPPLGLRGARRAGGRLGDQDSAARGAREHPRHLPRRRAGGRQARSGAGALHCGLEQPARRGSDPPARTDGRLRAGSGLRALRAARGAGSDQRDAPELHEGALSQPEGVRCSSR